MGIVHEKIYGPVLVKKRRGIFEHVNVQWTLSACIRNKTADL